MTPLSTPPPPSSPVSQQFNEMPFHLLIEETIEGKSEDQLRQMLQALQEDRTSPALRKAKAVRESNKLEGKKVKQVKLYVDDLM